MDSFLAAAIRSQRRVDILCEHVAVHLQVADDICAPPAVAATEQAEAKHAATTWVGDGVNLVELDSDQAGEERLVGVVDDAATLHDVGLFFEEAFGCPADVVRMGTVIGIENTGEVCLVGDVGEEVVEVIGFGCGVWDFNDRKLVILCR